MLVQGNNKKDDLMVVKDKATEHYFVVANKVGPCWFDPKERYVQPIVGRRPDAGSPLSVPIFDRIGEMKQRIYLRKRVR